MNIKKMGRTGFVFAALVAVLALALPAQADDSMSQADFVADCNDDGQVIISGGNQLEVLNEDGGQGQIIRNCRVTLSGEDSELTLGEGTNLLFQDDAGAYKNFRIRGDGAGFEIEVSVKKNSTIEAHNFVVNVTGAEEAEAQFEDNFCLKLHGAFRVSMGTGSDEGGDVQFKKFDAGQANCSAPNINVAGRIRLDVTGEDGEIQIEENNHLLAGGRIAIVASGEKTQVQSKKGVTLEAGSNIRLSSPGFLGEVQVEDDNTFTAGSNIFLVVGADGKLEVKKGTAFTAGLDIFIVPGPGASCSVEDPGTLGADCP